MHLRTPISRVTSLQGTRWKREAHKSEGKSCLKVKKPICFHAKRKVNKLVFQLTLLKLNVLIGILVFFFISLQRPSDKRKTNRYPYSP